jgi:hypothetical protein
MQSRDSEPAQRSSRFPHRTRFFLHVSATSIYPKLFPPDFIRPTPKPKFRNSAVVPPSAWPFRLSHLPIRRPDEFVDQGNRAYGAFLALSASMAKFLMAFSVGPCDGATALRSVARHLQLFCAGYSQGRQCVSRGSVTVVIIQ